jgi:hypothetical protein
MSGAGDSDGFLRFVVPSKMHPESQTAYGLLAMAYWLRDTAGVDPATEAELTGCIAWFKVHLPVPDRFNRSKSKGHYRRETRGLSWFRATATDAITIARALAAVVGRCGYPVLELRERRVGYVTYEDAQQVVAEPFRETRTR